MLRLFLIFSIFSSFTGITFAQEQQILLPPMPSSKQQESIAEIKSSKTQNTPPTIQEKSIQTKKEHKAVKKIPIKFGISSKEDIMYLSLVSTICIFINEQETTSCRITQYPDPISTVNGMLNGDVDIIITNTILGQYIMDDTSQFKDNMQAKKVRFAGAFFNEKLAILANRDLQIKNLDDLKNASINIGKQFTKQRMFFDQILKFKKWQISDFKRSDEIDINDEIKAICEKSVDSVIIVGQDMNQYMKEITRLCEVNVVKLTPEEISLFDNDKRFIKSQIKGGMYVGMPRDIDTVAIKAILLTTSDVPSLQIQEVLKIISQSMNKIKLLHQSLSDLTIESIIFEGRIAEPHDAVIKFTENNNLKERN